MRLITWVIIILVMITIISTMGYRYLLTTSDNLNQLLVKIKTGIHNNNWKQVKQLKRQLNTKWNQAQNIVPTLINHSELHDLEITLARISTLVEQKSKEKLLPEISIARKLTKNIKGQEKLNLRNIF